MSSATHEFEQPLNERMRSFMRLEHLYKRFDHQINQGDEWAHRGAIEALIEILAQKTKIPSAKVFLQTLLYQVTSKWEVRAAKEGGQPGEIMDYGEVYYDSQKKESIRTGS